MVLVRSSAAFQPGRQNLVMWQDDCDFVGSDTTASRGDASDCGDQCVDASDCTHWTWTHYDGGTCWLKNGKTATTSNFPGSNCGYVIDRFSLANSVPMKKTHTKKTSFRFEQSGKQSYDLNALQTMTKNAFESGQVVPGSGLVWTSTSSLSNFGNQKKALQIDSPVTTPSTPTVQTIEMPAPKPSFFPESSGSTSPASKGAPPKETSGPTSSDNGLTSAESDKMLASLNSYRAQSGLAALTIDSQLTAAAYGHSKDQASRCAMSHDGSDGSKSSDRVKAAGYDWSVVAENVAAGQASVEDVMTSWWNSPGHRENILKNDVTDVGFALVSTTSCSEYQTYWTQNFGAKM